jgi:outer membrane protein OmpA-like peptidoglycan-associated protein
MKKRISTFLTALMILNGLVLGLAVNESTSTPAHAANADYLPNENEGFFSSNAHQWLVNDNNTYMLGRHFVKVGILFYKLNKATREAMVAGYDHRIDTGTALVIPETIEVTAAIIESETAQIKSDFSGTYVVTYIGRSAFQTNAADNAPATPMLADFASITLPNTIKVIGAFAFFGQCTIREFVIPDSVTDIGMDAFLRMDPNTTNITQCANANIGLRKITIGSKVSRFYTGAFGRNTKLETMTIRADSANFETPTATTYPSGYDEWQYPNGNNGFITASNSATNTCTGNVYRLGAAAVTVQGAFYSGWTRWATNCFQTAAAVTAASFTPNQPDSPTVVSRTLTSVTVNVGTHTANGGSAITNYRVTAFPGGTFSDLPGATGGNIVISGLSNSTAYTFKVVATNAIGDSIPSIASASVSTLSPTVPNAPTIGTATAYDSMTVTVSYTAPISDGGSTITGYRATAYPNGETGTVTGSGSGTIYVGGLTTGVTDTFTVVAINAVGTSLPSAASNSVTPLITTVPPAAPAASDAPTGPPPSSIKLVNRPKISRTESNFRCTAGENKFIRSGRSEESITASVQVTRLHSNGLVVESSTAIAPFVEFTKRASYENTTLSCEVLIYQEGITSTQNSLDKDSIKILEARRVKDISQANYDYYKARDNAYLNRIEGSATSAATWKKALEQAISAREAQKVKASSDFIASLEEAGISILYVTKAKEVTSEPALPVIEKEPPVANIQPSKVMKRIGTIYFATGTYFINDASKKVIKELALVIAESDPSTLLSYGHTDSKGGTDNTLLSQNRAKAVARVIRSLIPGQKVVTGWYASSKPVAAGTSKADLAKNRRVEIYIK